MQFLFGTDSAFDFCEAFSSKTKFQSEGAFNLALPVPQRFRSKIKVLWFLTGLAIYLTSEEFLRLTNDIYPRDKRVRGMRNRFICQVWHERTCPCKFVGNKIISLFPVNFRAEAALVIAHGID